MSPIDAPHRERSNWPFVALFLLLGFAGGMVTYWEWPISAAPAPVRVASVAPTMALPTVTPAEPKPVALQPIQARPMAPTFDIVRVDPQGHSIIAGRAESGAEVTLRDETHVLGKTVADAQGAFVILPDENLKPGGRELTLSARGADGKETGGGNSVLLVVPAVQVATAEPAASAVAVLLPKDAAPTRVLQGNAANRKLALDTVDYDEKGEIRFSGSAKPESSVRVYVDNRPVADSKAGADGQWIVVPATSVTAGLHHLRVDQLGPDGRVLSRVELPFQRTVTTPETLASGRAVVQPGQNLWRIARQNYGQGTRYTVIYLANRDQIRDPNRIYPGQIFAVPPPL